MNKKTALKHLIIFAVLAVYITITWKTELDCPSKMLFSFPCPFCGMTTAFVEALKLNFTEAFRAHPLFPLALPLIFLALHKKLFPKIPQRLYSFILIFSAGLFFLLFIYRQC